MDFSKALDRTLKQFEITGKWLANESGVSQRMISSFRRGQQSIYTDSLEKILSALPDEAQKYFHELVLGQAIEARYPSALDLIEDMESTELAELLNAIADRLVHQQKVAV